MASPSRARIDQFFASKKKKKFHSPYLKPDGAEKGLNIANLEGSPSAKGSLDGFLVSSPNDKRTAKLVNRAHVSSDAQDFIKRNLADDLNSVYRAGQSQISNAEQGEGQKKQTQDPIEVKDVSDLNPQSLASAANPELKQFATDFLSLYCSDLPSSISTIVEPKAHAYKRQGSPTLLVAEDKSSKRRHCVSREEPQVKNDVIDCYEKHQKEGNQSVIAGRGSKNVDHCNEMIVGTTPVGLGGSLRKCNRTSLIVGCETPKSARGSSLFSPGEAFWDEAIEIADGLLVKKKIFSFERSMTKAQRDKNSNDFRNLACGDVLQKTFNEGLDSVCGVDVNAPVGSQKGHGKDIDMDSEISPLPVKHFDFSFEDRNSKNGISFVRYEDINPRVLNESASSGNLSETEVGSMKHDNDSIACSTPSAGKGNSMPNGDNGDGTPSSFMLLKDCLDLSHWLPLELCNIYKKKGISKLYPWQVDCLLVDGVLQRRNLVYCASTSAGKSFVAEILMLRRIISTKKIALLVLPYVSICAEKAEHLEVLLEPLGMHVRSYYGNQGGGTLPKDTSVAVCTIEKANSLINRLLEEGRLSEVGIVVIDELHMVGDQSRGYLLELLLTKLRYAAGEGSLESSSGESSGTSSGKNDPAHGLQIVGMSATLPNVASVADWLQAALYQTEFRPVPLEEYIKVGNAIYDKEMHIIRSMSKLADLGGKDPDHIVELCNEVVQEGNSVLIFCSSRKGCESTARHVAKFLKKIPVSAHNDNNDSFDITSAIDTLRRCPVGLDPVLEEALPCGVAYHHAGLTVEEREIVEMCYRKGLVRVLTATSTLAAGVNLPARRVIFRQPRIGLDFIDGTRYKQMSGRAGRTGIDTKGESILLCKPEEIKRITKILNDSCPPLHSCLSEDKNGMTHAILEVVAGGMVQSAKDIHRYVRCTLLNSTQPFENVVKSAQDSLKWLCHKKFLEWNEESKLYSSTPLGRASFGSSLNPEDSLIVLDDLSRAREGFVLSSDLHLVYLVTPTNVGVEPDWELFYERFMQLSTLDQSVGNRVGVAEPFLMRMAHGAPMRTLNALKDKSKDLFRGSDRRGGMDSHNMLSNDQTLRVCKRFYVALILSRLVQEIPVPDVCGAFKVARGMVQALQENAGRFASMVSVFCERLGWHDLESLVSKFQNRVSFGVRAEIVELTTIPYVKGSRARAMYKAGLRTPQAIAEASVAEIGKALFESSSWAAQEDSAQRRVQLGVAKKIKNGARKIVLEKAEEARVAAFSAFKSLGFDVAQISQPLILKPVDRGSQKEATVSSGGENSSGSVGKPPRSHVITKPSMERSKDLAKVGAQIRENKANKAGLGLGVSNQVEVSFKKHTALNNNNVIEDSKSSGTLHEIKSTNDCNSNGDNPSGQPQVSFNGTPRAMGTGSPSAKGPVNAVNTPGGFDSFLDLWDSTREFYYDVHFNKLSGMNSTVPFDIHGIAICWENSPVYYVNLPKDLLCHRNKMSETSPSSNQSDIGHDLVPEDQLKIAQQRWDRIGMIMVKKDVRKFTWNLKNQIQVLKQPAVSMQRLGSLSVAVKTMDIDVVDSSYYKLSPTYVQSSFDLSIVAWILWPDEEKSSNPNLEREVKKRLSDEDAAFANRCGRWKNQIRRAAHNGCCRRVAQTRALCSVLWKLLVSEALVEALTTIEMPLVNILAEMEIRGIGVDMEGCLRARQVLGRKLKFLESEAYRLAGMTFSLYTAADIANVLYEHLKLPIPEGSDKAKQHPSTAKPCLDLLRHEHPIVPVIKEHRSLAKLLNSTLGSICSLSKLSMRTGKYTLHGRWLQTSTATGRLSMEEPNLQCVEHMVDFVMNNNTKKDGLDVDSYEINARDFFVPTQENWILLAADYSQIELRLMAHFSKEASLIELLSKPHVDVFAMIAAKWTARKESVVTSQERDQTKKLVYGILYGMGPRTLAEQLNCSLSDAVEKIKSFKLSFPGVSAWLQGAVDSCRGKGYVETLGGRKRYLTKINLGNNKEQSKAQRQAVNSICQGSAADIIKIAMINIHSAIVEEADESYPCSKYATSFHMLRGRCRILLQVHDELVMEADPSVLKEAGSLLQVAMEKAVSLLVPLHIKLKVGKTWGSMEPFSPDQHANDFVIPNS